MRDLADKVRVAVVQATPVMFNKKQSTVYKGLHRVGI